MVNKRSKGSNKLKRKRGKKFRFFDSDPTSGKDSKILDYKSENPFDQHSKSKKAMKDKEKVRYYFYELEVITHRRVQDSWQEQHFH